MRYEPHRFHDGYLQITVKDRGLLGNGIFLGEAFLPLNELKLGDLDQRLSDLPQIQLPLTRPTGYGETFFFIIFYYKTSFLKKFVIFFSKLQILMLCWPWIQDNLITWPKISYRKKNESCDVERNCLHFGENL